MGLEPGVEVARNPGGVDADAVKTVDQVDAIIQRDFVEVDDVA